MKYRINSQGFYKSQISETPLKSKHSFNQQRDRPNYNTMCFDDHNAGQGGKYAEPLSSLRK